MPVTREPPRSNGIRSGSRWSSAARTRSRGLMSLITCPPAPTRAAAGRRPCRGTGRGRPGRRDRYRAGAAFFIIASDGARAYLVLLVADPGPEPALLDEHDLLGLVAVVGNHDPVPVDDARKHRLLARDRLAKDAGYVFDGRELVPGRDLSHEALHAPVAQDERELRHRRRGQVPLRPFRTALTSSHRGRAGSSPA